MAMRAGMSRARFAAHFWAVVGETPGAYLVRWRVSVPQTLLKQGRPLKLIANLVGYANGSALTRAFTATTGTSPTEWSARMR